MENKVIVDDVDVSECDNLAILQDRMTDKEFTFCNAYQEDCSERENCHYKQLQRLKHQYADVLKLAKENADSNEFCLQELEQENERLKNDLNEAYEHYNFKRIYNEVINAENFKYKQALREIRDIVSEPCIVDENCQTCNSGCMQKDIIAKINEVIGVN